MSSQCRTEKARTKTIANCFQIAVVVKQGACLFDGALGVVLSWVHDTTTMIAEPLDNV